MCCVPTSDNAAAIFRAWRASIKVYFLRDRAPEQESCNEAPIASVPSTCCLLPGSLSNAFDFCSRVALKRSWDYSALNRPTRNSPATYDIETFHVTRVDQCGRNSCRTELLSFRPIDDNATIRRGLPFAPSETTASPSSSGPSQTCRIFVVEGTSDVELGDLYSSDATAVASLAGRLLYVERSFLFS